MTDGKKSRKFVRPAGTGVPGRPRRNGGAITEDRPDDVFEGPGFRMVRRGRYLEVKTHRSPGEQRELNRRMRESRPEILAEIQRKTTELLGIVHKYTSLDVAANLLLREIFHDPDEYVESESKLRPHWVEHATVLELQDPRYELREPVLVDAVDVEHMHKLLEEIFMQTTWYYLAESSNPDASGPPSPIDELRFSTLLHGMSVRSPAYASHWREVLLGLFGKGSAIERLSDEHKLDIRSALAIVDGIEEYILEASQGRFEKARAAYKDFHERLRAYTATGKFTGEAHEKEVFDRVRNMRGKDAKRYIKYVMAEWTRVALGTIFSFTPEQIAELSGIGLERVRALFDQLSLEFGISLPDILPAPVNALHERPIIRYDGKSFCSVPHLLPWAVKPAFERVLQSGPTWNAYQKQRSSFLVSTAIGYFTKMLPGAVPYESLFYPVGPGQEGELDGLVLFDRYAFLIEGKAGSLGKARRGGKDKIITQLEGLVGDAADQVVRADNYIRKTSVPTFRTATRGTIAVDKARYSERVLVTVTLDVLDIFTADMYQMRDIGVVKTHDLPWCVALTDLRAISDILVRPFELTHYIRWRLATIDDSRLHGGKDELNWLAVYLKEGPTRPTVPGNFTDLTFTSYTDDFDAYFLYKEGARTIPAPRPAQAIPSPVSTLCECVAAEGAQGFTRFCELLLDLTFDERARFAQNLVELAFNEKRGRKAEFRFEGTALAVEVVARTLAERELSEKAAALERLNKARALVISLTSQPTWRVHAWVVAG